MHTLYVISGMAGMTGSELARQALAEGDTVMGFDNFFASSPRVLTPLEENQRYWFMPFDLNCKDEMERLQTLVFARKHEFKSLVYVNCAAVVHTEHFYHVEITFSTNVLGMRSFLQQAIDVGADCFVNCSTSEVYSMHSWEPGGVREDAYLTLATAEHSQRTSYAAGKLMTEFFVKDAVADKKMKGCSIRFANVYSNDELYPKHIIPHIFTSLLESGGVTLLENARETRRTFLHNSDSCSAVLSLIHHTDALDGSVYNVATDEEILIVDLVKLIAHKMNLGDPVIRFQGTRSSDPVRRLLSSEKIWNRTGWRPKVGLSEGLDAVISSQNKLRASGGIYAV